MLRGPGPPCYAPGVSRRTEEREAERSYLLSLPVTTATVLHVVLMGQGEPQTRGIVSVVLWLTVALATAVIGAGQIRELSQRPKAAKQLRSATMILVAVSLVLVAASAAIWHLEVEHAELMARIDAASPRVD